MQKKFEKCYELWKKYYKKALLQPFGNSNFLLWSGTPDIENISLHYPTYCYLNWCNNTQLTLATKIDIYQKYI